MDLRIRTWLALLVSVGLGCAAATERGPQRIILIVVDTLRADHVGAYGGDPITPAIDDLAARGQVFRDVVASYNMTSQSMAAMFTGATPSLETGESMRRLEMTRATRCGLARFLAEGDRGCVPQALTTLAEDLAAAGYWCAGIAANPLLFRPYGFDQGFHRWEEVGTVPSGRFREQSRTKHALSRRGELVNQRVRAVLRDRASDRFFLYVHYLDAHDWLLLGKSYRAAVQEQDRVLAALLALLEGEGLLEDATVILTSDHGEALGEVHPVASLGTHLGNPSYEPVLRVPLIVAPPFFERVDDPLRGEDLRDLVREVAGLDPLVDVSSRNELFLSEKQYQTYRDGRYKSMWPRDGGPPMLFHLRSDPEERRDVGRDQPDVLAQHRARLDELSQELAAQPRSRRRDTEDDLERLRALGYLE